jgi:hypothetical protein
VYGVFGFVNKYLHFDHAGVVFHDDDPYVLKEIKSYLEGNGYEIRSRWAIINTLPQMSSEPHGKMLCFHLFSSQNPFDSKHSLSISNFGHFLLANLIGVGPLFLSTTWVVSSFKKLTQTW